MVDDSADASAVCRGGGLILFFVARWLVKPLLQLGIIWSWNVRVVLNRQHLLGREGENDSAVTRRSLDWIVVHSANFIVVLEYDLFSSVAVLPERIVGRLGTLPVNLLVFMVSQARAWH